MYIFRTKELPDCVLLTPERSEFNILGLKKEDGLCDFRTEPPFFLMIILSQILQTEDISLFVSELPEDMAASVKRHLRTNVVCGICAAPADADWDDIDELADEVEWRLFGHVKIQQTEPRKKKEKGFAFQGDSYPKIFFVFEDFGHLYRSVMASPIFSGKIYREKDTYYLVHNVKREEVYSMDYFRQVEAAQSEFLVKNIKGGSEFAAHLKEHAQFLGDTDDIRRVG